ncbi:methyltransferase 17, mitochondrial [Olea europaea subsp. europaea]|uniref:Methyltransferase 17, mitochondrial n=2 Tax=Olea europaea subsp. europaea TaxID=158383 RepID=A0A8S0UZC9_OLEEU|nr:methyltransferase 17, mitochondrial [Olea europaea subsp. europaea]
MTRKTGAFVVAPCPHDGARPLQNTDKYCHFVQRLRGHHHSEHTRFSVSLCLPPWE